MKIAYFGDEKSHTYAAARRLFANGEFVGYKTVEQVCRAVDEGDCCTCVIPAENSVEGSVNACFDALLSRKLFIRAEITMRIHHSLVVRDGAKAEEIRVVYSHPQALSQCRNYLETHLPQAQQIAVYSTSYALTLLDDGTKAAVALTADKGERILARGIEDFSNNATRFLALGKAPKAGGSKASVVFGAPNRPGGLLEILQVFADYGVNMTAITSRPSRAGMGDYIFFADYTSPAQSGGDGAMLDALRSKTAFLKFLGSYDGTECTETCLNKVEA